MLFGPLADRAFDRAKGPALVAAAVLIIGTVVFWRVRRRRRATAPGAWMEATCPACIGVSLLAGHLPGVAGLTAPDPVRPPSRCFEGGQQAEEPAGNVDVSPGAFLGRGDVELAVQLDEQPLDVPHPGDML
jgi:hypothetical protein